MDHIYTKRSVGKKTDEAARGIAYHRQYCIIHLWSRTGKRSRYVLEWCVSEVRDTAFKRGGYMLLRGAAVPELACRGSIGRMYSLRLAEPEQLLKGASLSQFVTPDQCLRRSFCMCCSQRRWLNFETKPPPRGVDASKVCVSMKNRAVAKLGICFLPQKTTAEYFPPSRRSPLTSRSASKRCASRRRASIVSVKPSLLCGLLCLIPLALTWCSQFSRKLNAMHANPKKLQLPRRIDRTKKVATPSQSFCSEEKAKSTGE